MSSSNQLVQPISTQPAQNASLGILIFQIFQSIHLYHANQFDNEEAKLEAS